MNEIGKLNTAIYRNMQILISNRLSGLDIRNGQYDFFLVIAQHEGFSQKELSKWLHVGKSTTAKAVKNLVNKGYVKKVKDEKDGRMEHLYLTEQGKKEAPKVEKIFKKNVDTAAKGMSDTDVKKLTVLMNKVLENLVDENNSKQ